MPDVPDYRLIALGVLVLVLVGTAVGVLIRRVCRRRCACRRIHPSP